MLLQKCAPVLRAIGRRQYSLWRPGWGLVHGSPMTRLLNQMEREVRDMERIFDRSFWFKPFAIQTPSISEEHFHMEQPIVEEDGKKKFKLFFDVSRFKPEEISVKTSKGKVVVVAKHESKTEASEAKYKYFREFAIPEGVKIEEMTCKYTADGSLLVEAPYTPPPKVDKQQDIPIKHE